MCSWFSHFFLKFSKLIDCKDLINIDLVFVTVELLMWWMFDFRPVSSEGSI